MKVLYYQTVTSLAITHVDMLCYQPKILSIIRRVSHAVTTFLGSQLIKLPKTYGCKRTG